MAGLAGFERAVSHRLRSARRGNEIADRLYAPLPLLARHDQRQRARIAAEQPRRAGHPARLRGGRGVALSPDGLLLAGGGARGYVEALAPFGLNPRDPAFWTIGTKRLEGLIDRFEALV